MFDAPDRLAARFRATAPAGPGQGEGWSTRDPELDPDGVLIGRLVALERLKAAADAESMVIMAELCDRAESWADPTNNDGGEVAAPVLVADEIAPALHLSPVTASMKVYRAQQIAHRLPATLAAYGRGELDLGRVLAIEDATCDLDPADAEEVEALVLPGGVDQTAAELRAALRRAVITVDPKAAEKRRKAAIRARSVTRYQRQDGTSAIEAVLSAIDTGEIYELVDEVARRSKTTGDTRTIGARRADALVFLLLGRDPHLGPEDPPGENRPPGDDTDQPTPPDDHTDAPLPDEPADLDDRFGPEPDHPDWRPERTGCAQPTAASDPCGADEPFLPEPQLSELVARCLAALVAHRRPVLPWVAINHTTGPNGQPVQVGELDGYGPITAEYAQWLHRAGATRPPPQPSGREPTAAEARAHDPPAWLDDEVRARDGTCRFPGCRRAATRCDLDHTIAHPEGLTCAGNLGALCRRHHRVKHSGAWTVELLSDTTMHWTSTITSRTYDTHPRGNDGTWRGTTTGWSEPTPSVTADR